MSVHAITMAKYNTKRVQSSTRTAQVINDDKRVPDLNQTDDSCPPLTKKPKIPAVLFPEDRLPRPAVIGVRGTYGTYPDNTTAIKEILTSVLKRGGALKSPSTDVQVQGSDLETGEDNSPSSSIEDSNSEREEIPLLPRSRKDVRFFRHTAVWDNRFLESPSTSPSGSLADLPRVPNTIPLECTRCSGETLPGSELVSPTNLNADSQKENRRFSSPSIAVDELKPCDPPLEKFTATDTKASTVNNVKSFKRRSQSCSSLVQASTSGSESPYHFDDDFFGPTVNLEKENEHFLAADIFISLVEMMKCSRQYERWKIEGGISWMIKATEEPNFQRRKAKSESSTSVDSGYEGLPACKTSSAETILEEEEEEEEEDECCETESFDFEDFVVIEWKTKDKAKRNPPPKNSAAETARKLYRALRPQWNSDRDEQLAAGQAMGTSPKNIMPEEFESSVRLVEGIKRWTIWDADDWYPPRFEIITKLHPYLTRDEIIKSQNYVCAGCGTKVEPRYTSRLRYCEYLGQYFCHCCHYYFESAIPARILSKWNFSKYYVSNFAKNLLDKIWDREKFDVESENPAVYKKVKDLNRVKEVQQQLIHIRRLVTTCRFADEGLLNTFDRVPPHLTQELHMFTLADLEKVKQKTLLPKLRELLTLAVTHVENCELCSAKGFICEFCKNPAVIFPFQTDLCRRCEDCKACYHKECFKTHCPKCIRMKTREAQYSDSPLLSSCEMASTSKNGLINFFDCELCYHERCFKLGCPKCVWFKVRKVLHSDSPLSSHCEEETTATTRV